MESTEAVLSGATKADAAWFANAKYLLSDPQGQARVKLQEKIMLSPITVGVSESAAKKLGWDDPATAGKVTWRTISKAASEGKLSYALPNPATSNQGFMALMGVVAAASDKADARSPPPTSTEARSPASSRATSWSATTRPIWRKFIEGQGPRLNAFINYESWLLTLNNGGKLKEKLVLVYPKEGVSTADYPFMLLQEIAPRRLPEGRRLPRGGEATWLARQTLRRPISAEVAGQVADLFKAGGTLVELALLARPAAVRRPDRRLPQRVPPADRLDLRDRHQRQRKAAAGGRSWCRRSTTSRATTARSPAGWPSSPTASASGCCRSPTGRGR
jgi:Ca-activated chloride channel family protein